MRSTPRCPTRLLRELDRRCDCLGWMKIDLEPGEEIGRRRIHRARTGEHVEHPRVDRLPVVVVALEHAIALLWRKIDGGIFQLQRFGDQLPDERRVIRARLFGKRVSEQSEAKIAVEEPCMCRFRQAVPAQEEVEIARAIASGGMRCRSGECPPASPPIQSGASPDRRA